MHRRLKFLLSVLLLISFYGCEYELEKLNNRNIDPPAETPRLDLNLIPEGDTIPVYMPIEFAYSINTYGLNIKDANFYLGIYYWPVESETGSLLIEPFQFEEGYQTLTLIMNTNSGTGSIAESIGEEGYTIEKSWVLLIDGHPDLTMTKGLTSDGFLIITWPKWELNNFDSYELNGYINGRSIHQVIRDVDHVSYIDSFYIGGKGSIGINYTATAGNQTYYLYGNGISLNDSVPELQFEDLGLDSLRIFWKNSIYKAKFKLIISNPYPSILIESTTDTSYTISQPGFGLNLDYRLYTSPYYIENTETQDTKIDYGSHVLGHYLGDYHIRYGYNQMDKVVYTNSDDSLNCFDITNLSLYKAIEVPHLTYQGHYSCPTNSQKVAVASADSIYIFPDKNLQNPVRIPYYCHAIYIYHFYLTDNNLLAIVLPNKYELYDAETKNLVLSFDLVDYPDYSEGASITTSKDGKFACVTTPNSLRIYNIETGTANLTYTDNRSYRKALFNINNPGQLIMTFTNTSDLEIRNVSDFSLVKSISLPTVSEVICNIDPESGYMLLTNLINLCIVDIENSETILEIKSSDPLPSLYGNRLFSNSGYTIDISEYLKK